MWAQEAIHWVQSHGIAFIPHAGEAAGPESIWDALQFRPPRIGHGFRAIEDPALVDILREKKITLEVCPTSNVRTGCVSGWEGHPLRRLWDANVPVTINSDDPPMFNTTLLGEYRVAVTRFGFRPEDLAILSLNAASASLLSPAERLEMIKMFQMDIEKLGMSIDTSEMRQAHDP